MSRRILAVGGLVSVALLIAATYAYLSWTRCTRAVKVGTTSLAAASEFSATFPVSRRSVSYCDGRYGQPTWQSSTTLFGRYILTMQMPVRIGRFGMSVEPSGSPTWTLTEVTSVSGSPSGQTSIEYGDVRDISADQWKLIVDANGKVEQVIHELNTTSPVAGIGSAPP